MKKFLFFVFVITAFFLASMFAIEKSGIILLGRTNANAVFTETPHGQVLSWDKLPYPCYYRIDTISITKGKGENKTVKRVEKSEFSLSASCRLESSAVPTEYVITPYGMFGSFGYSFPVTGMDNNQSLSFLNTFVFHYCHPNNMKKFRSNAL